MSNPIVDHIKEQITKFETKIAKENIGSVVEVGDGIARATGLADVKASEIVEFASLGGRRNVALQVQQDAHQRIRHRRQFAKSLLLRVAK